MKYVLVIFFSILLYYCAFAKHSNFSLEAEGVNVEQAMMELGISNQELDSMLARKSENPRTMSIVLDLLLGPFGGHRLYLGTSAHVPVIYTVTLGGGLGILPIIDLFHLIFTKDLDVYRNNDRIFMWSKGKPTPR